jgi:hypothetical protein
MQVLGDAGAILNVDYSGVMHAELSPAEPTTGWGKTESLL